MMETEKILVNDPINDLEMYLMEWGLSDGSKVYSVTLENCYLPDEKVDIPCFSYEAAHRVYECIISNSV